MSSSKSLVTRVSFRRLSQKYIRNASTTAQAQKREGTIADAFASLSGQQFGPLEPRFAAVKSALISGREDAVHASWKRLLSRLQDEVRIISHKKSSIIPAMDFKDIESASKEFSEEYRKRGVAVIRNVIPEEEVLQMKDELRQYIAANPHTKGRLLRITSRLTRLIPSCSLSSRQPSSIRALLVTNTGTCTSTSEPAQGTSLPPQFLALERSSSARLISSNCLRR